MKQEKDYKNLALTIKSVLMGLGLYFLFRIVRNNYYFPLISPLEKTNPPLHQVLMYLGHLIFLVGMLAYFYFVKEDRHCLKAAKFKPKDILYIVIGLAIGFLLNGSNILIAFLHNDINMVHCKFDPTMIVLSFFAVAIQSSIEEIQYRLWIHKRIFIKAPLIYAAIGSSFAFGWSHMMNQGVTIVALLNIILVGILCVLFLEVTGNIWIGCAYHAAWNFTQNFIYGLPNSGYPAVLTMMQPTFTKKSLCYDPTFGVEGTVIGLLLNIVAIAIMYLIYRKKQK